MASVNSNETWTRHLPPCVLDRIQQHPVLAKIATNTGWLVVDKVINMVAGLLVGAWVARYLGPAQYGLLSYALAFVALFSPLAGLGLTDIVIRNIVRQPEDRNEILGTAFILRFLAGLLTLGGSIGIAYISRAEDTLTRCLIAILSGSLVFKTCANTLDIWFQSQIQSKYSVWARNLALVVIALAKVGLILLRAPLVAFAWATLAQTVVFALSLAVWYRMKAGHFSAWQAKRSQAKQLLRDSWPLIISGLAIMIYMRIDQIMLGNMASEGSLGVYSAAVRLSELWYFIPMAIASSFFPTVIRSRERRSEVVYRERMQLFFDIMAGVAYAIVIPTALLAPLVVTTLFGVDYAEAGLILRVHIWAFVFVSLGVARSRWLMAENATKFSMVTTIVGAVVNVGLNFWLIPQHGGLGAAWATLVSQAISAYLSTLLSQPFWPLLGQLSLSLLVPFRLPSLWKAIHARD